MAERWLAVREIKRKICGSLLCPAIEDYLKERGIRRRVFGSSHKCITKYCLSDEDIHNLDEYATNHMCRLAPVENAGTLAEQGWKPLSSIAEEYGICTNTARKVVLALGWNAHIKRFRPDPLSFAIQHISPEAQQAIQKHVNDKRNRKAARTR